MRQHFRRLLALPDCAPRGSTPETVSLFDAVADVARGCNARVLFSTSPSGERRAVVESLGDILAAAEGPTDADAITGLAAEVL